MPCAPDALERSVSTTEPRIVDAASSGFMPVVQPATMSVAKAFRAAAVGVVPDQPAWRMMAKLKGPTVPSNSTLSTFGT
jgi:hypothetical protein